MENTSLARKAGIVGMVGGVLWLVSAVMQHNLGIASPASGSIWIVHEMFAIGGIICMIVGFLGLLWGAAFPGRFGTIGVGFYAVGWGLIVLGGIIALLIGTQDSPLMVIYPIGGLVYNIGEILIGIAVIVAGRWSGWQRWAPLAYAAFSIFAITLPMIVGITPDGPGAASEYAMGVLWFLVGLAVYTAQPKAVTSQPTAVGQA